MTAPTQHNGKPIPPGTWLARAAEVAGGQDETMTAPTPDLKFLARNIINQIGDLWYEQIPSEKWVPVRQATNDQLDIWVAGLLEDALAAATTERDQERERADRAEARIREARKAMVGNQTINGVTDRGWLTPDEWLLDKVAEALGEDEATA